MNTTRHSLMAKSLAVLLSLLILIFAFTYSWFSSSDSPAYATGLSVTASSSVDFEIAVGFSNAQTQYNYVVSDFGKHFELNDVEDLEGNHYNVLNDYSPLDVSSDGVVFYRPELMSDGHGGKIPTGNNFYAVEANKEYISFDLIFKCEKNCNVYIDSGSVVKARCEVEAGKVVENSGNKLTALNLGSANLSNSSLTSQLLNMTGFDTEADAYNQSSYGDFSKDAVVGAIRVSFVDYNNLSENDVLEDTLSKLKSVAEFIWIPRPDIFLQTIDDNVSDWVLHTVDLEDANDPYAATTKTHSYYSYSTGETVTYTGDNKKTVTECNSDVVVNLDVPHYNNGVVDYYYGKTRVNIWIEGADAEARRAIAGGAFYINFDLRAG